ncbi:MAG: hypothetical protein ACLT3H_03230 [Roseburia sp.]
MEDIMEQYGSSLLQMIGGVGVLFLFLQMLCRDGVLYIVLLEYMAGICG